MHATSAGWNEHIAQPQDSIGLGNSLGLEKDPAFVGKAFVVSSPNYLGTLPPNFKAPALSRVLQALLQAFYCRHAPQTQLERMRRHVPLTCCHVWSMCGLTRRAVLWLPQDMHGASYGRDIEPTVEGGTELLDITASCIRVFRRAVALTTSSCPSAELCCQSKPLRHPLPPPPSPLPCRSALQGAAGAHAHS